MRSHQLAMKSAKAIPNSSTWSGIRWPCSSAEFAAGWLAELERELQGTATVERR